MSRSIIDGDQRVIRLKDSFAGRASNAAYARLKGAIADGERQLSQPLKGGSAGGYTAEIRAHVKGLSQADRLAFMNDTVRSTDTKTLSAVLGAPSYLSGLSPVERDLLTHGHQERTNPALAKHLVVMKAAHDLIAQRGGLIFDEIDKAIGARSMQVANLRPARVKAEKAYTFTA